MQELIPFNFADREVRVVTLDGEPWFVVNDVCAVLEIKNPYDVIRRIDVEDLDRIEVLDARGVSQQTNIVNESGLYDLIFRSDKPAARDFRRWVTREVLPSIRKTGMHLPVKLSNPALQRIVDLTIQAQILEDRVEAAERAQVETREELRETVARVGALEGTYGRRTALAYARVHGLPSGQTFLNQIGRRAAKIAGEAGIPRETVDSARWAPLNSWPDEIWAEAFGIA